MPKNIQIRTPFINCKDIPKAEPKGIKWCSTPLNKRKGGIYSLVKQSRGKLTYDLTEADAHADGVCAELEAKLLKFTYKYYAGYSIQRSTIAQAGDTLTPLRSSLLLEVRRFIQSYAQRDWYYVKAHIYAINTKWLQYHQACLVKARGKKAVYRDALNIHHEGNFIPKEERTLFGRRKKTVSK